MVSRRNNGILVQSSFYANMIVKSQISIDALSTKRIIHCHRWRSASKQMRSCGIATNQNSSHKNPNNLLGSDSIDFIIPTRNKKHSNNMNLNGSNDSQKSTNTAKTERATLVDQIKQSTADTGEFIKNKTIDAKDAIVGKTTESKDAAGEKAEETRDAVNHTTENIKEKVAGAVDSLPGSAEEAGQAIDAAAVQARDMIDEATKDESKKN